MTEAPRDTCLRGNSIILYGLIGQGKTITALRIAERIRLGGGKVAGILSLRTPREGSMPSYDALDLATGRTFPLVQPSGIAQGDDWETYGNPVFSFSKNGLREANSVLINASGKLKESTTVFVDEYGRLESSGLGIYAGFNAVVNSLSNGGLAFILCRGDKLGEVSSILEGKGVNVLTVEVVDFETVWAKIETILHGNL